MTCWRRSVRWRCCSAPRPYWNEGSRTDVAFLLELLSTGLQDPEPAQRHAALACVRQLLHPDEVQDCEALGNFSTLLFLLVDHMQRLLDAHLNAPADEVN